MIIFATKSNSMKRIFLSVIPFLTILSFLISCEPAEQPSVMHKMMRIASVSKENGKMKLSFDYTGESYNLSNFNTEADADANDVKVGDRVCAYMTLKAVGSYVNSVINLDSLTKLPSLTFATTKPKADTMDSFYQLSVLEMVGLDLVGKDSYPTIWNNGHHVCVSPVYFSPVTQPNPTFAIWPDSVKSDTLMLKLYANIPGNDYSLRPYYRQSLLNIDISDIRSNISDPVEKARRDALMLSLDTLGKSEIYVEISTLDVTYAENSKNVSNPIFINNTKQVRTVKIPLDF